MSIEFNLRDYEKEDESFIAHTWLSSNYRTHMPKNVYNSEHGNLVRSFLATMSSNVIMAVDKEDPSLIFGYFAYSKLPDSDMAHYIYVKRGLQGNGIATQLIKAAKTSDKVFHTHTNEVAKKLMIRLLSNWESSIYNPYIFYNQN